MTKYYVKTRKICINTFGEECGDNFKLEIPLPKREKTYMDVIIPEKWKNLLVFVKV